MKGYRNLSALALGVLCLAAASVAATSKASTGTHVVTASGRTFLLDGKPSFLIAAQARVCPDTPDTTAPNGTATIAQSLAALDVKIVLGRFVDCGGNVNRLDQALEPLQMLWQETSDGVGPQPDGLSQLVDFQMPYVSVQDSSDLPCGAYSTAGLSSKLASAANKGPVMVWVPIGSSQEDGQYVCLTPQKIRNEVMTALVYGVTGVGWSTIDPRNATIGNGFSVSRGDKGQPDNYSAVQALALKIESLAPVLTMGKRLKVIIPKGAPIRASAWSYQHTVTILAVTSDRPAKTVVSIPALGKSGKIKLNLKKIADVTIKKKMK